MRILHVIDSLASAGGAENRFVEEIVRFDDTVEQSVVTLFERDDLLPRLQAAGIPVRCLGMRASSAGRTFPLAGLRLARIVRRERPDVIHTALFHADAAGQIAAILTRTPVVSSLVSSADVELRDKRPGGAQRRAAVLDHISRLLSRMSRARYRAISQHAAASFVDSGGRGNRIRIIPRGLDLGSSGAPDRSRFGLPDRVPLVVNVARHESRKGHVELIEAFAAVRERIPNAVLAVAGREGSETGAMRATIDRLGLGHAVVLLGYRSDVSVLLASCDLFVFTSFSEGLGTAVIEAVAAGKPVVAFDIPAVRESTDDGRLARLVSVGDIRALGDALSEELASAATGSEARRRAGRDWVLGSYEANAVSSALCEYLAEVAEVRQRSARTPMPARGTGEVVLGRGTLVISIDLEMEWGYIHHGDFGLGYENRDERQVITRILEIFDRYKISATWATVGHLFLEACAPIDGLKHADVERPRYEWMKQDWFANDPCTDAASSPGWYAPDVVQMIRACPTHQELASHSFTHMIAGDPARTAESFSADLRACQEAAGAGGLSLRSFVYPRNAIGHVDQLGSAGFRCYRGSAPNRFAELPRLANRVLRIVDRLRPTQKTAAFPMLEGDVWNIPQSFLFNPADRSKLRPWLFQAKRRLHQASRENSVFHLWFHPQNISQDPAVALRALEDLLREARHLIDRGQLRNFTMADLAHELDTLHR